METTVDILSPKAFVQLSSTSIMRFFECLSKYFIERGVSLVRLSSADVMRCVEYFEGGAENIYFLDDDGRYILKALQRKDCCLSGDTDWKLVMPIVSLKPVSFSLPIDEKNSDQLQTLANKAFARNKGLSELPIVGNDGRIIAITRLHKESHPAFDWKKVANIKYGLPQGKLYVSSIENTELKAMFETLNDVDMELMTEANLDMIISGKAEGTLVYGADVYPEIRKISVEELYARLVTGILFEKNRDAFKACAGFHMNFDEMPTTVGKLPKVESKVKNFLSQVESELPILLEDAYDIEELTWMCDRLRTSDRFGADNKLYLQYSSQADFLKSMETLDWTEIANSGKAVFLFDDEQKLKYYPTTAEPATPAPLQVDEIVELVNSFMRGFSGSDFFNMILDSHPYLLTVGWHGLSSFVILWEVFCKDKTVKEAVEHLRNPNGEEELGLRDINLSHALKYRYEERLPAFLDSLSLYLEPDKIYGLHDWFKAFYLSANAAVGRKFLQRIAPTIFYDRHGGMAGNAITTFNTTLQKFHTMEYEMVNEFKYKRRVGIVRSPLGTLGCSQNRLLQAIKTHANSPLEHLKSHASGKSYTKRYMNANDPEFPVSAHVRFEDLKLYPRETTEKLCEFLRIPWSESCLHITTNGEDSGIVDGTAGFDVRPVYKTHLEYMSTLDYYRIELLNAKAFQVYGYKLKYYDGTKFSAEDLKKLFDIPFKVETMTFAKWSDWPNQEEIKEFHEWILQRAIDVMEHGEPDYSVDKDGKPLRLVEVLVPDLKPGQRLFEC